MSGLYYLLFGIAILVIIWWCQSNDKGSDTDGFTGLLAIGAPKTKSKASDQSRNKSLKPDRDLAGR